MRDVASLHRLSKEICRELTLFDEILIECVAYNGFERRYSPAPVAAEKVWANWCMASRLERSSSWTEAFASG